MFKLIFTTLAIFLIGILHSQESIFEEMEKGYIPKWMKNQIEEDLAPYRDQKISISRMRSFFSDQMTSDRIVEIQIKNNKIKRFITKELSKHFLYGWYLIIDQALNDLAKLVSLPNVTFFLCIHDVYQHNAEFPIFVFAKAKQHFGQCMIPDPIAFNAGYQTLSKGTILRDVIPWERKIGKMVWRGSTGQWIDPETGEKWRLTLCELSEKYRDLIDAGFTFVYNPDDCESGDIKELKTYGRERLSYEEMLEYKYQMWIDGYGASFSASGWRLFSNSVVFKPESNNTQWYYAALQPYVHYIPIQANLEDLVEKIQWMQTDDAYAKEVAENAREFALTHIVRTESLCYLYSLIMEYSRLQFTK